MADRWNNLTVVDEDPEFLDDSNCVISDGSIPNGEDNNDTDVEKTRKRIYQYGTWVTEKG